MLLELAEGLAQKGWEVTVITGFPNYPGGAVFDGYKKRLFQEEWVRGVRVRRVYLYTSSNRNYLNRILTFSSFTISSAVALMSTARPNLVLAVLQPLSQGVVLPGIARLKRAKLVFSIQDLHPDAQIKLGMVRSRLLIKMLKAVERYSYRHADALQVICEDFKSHCIENGAEQQSIAVIRNWIDLDLVKPRPRVNAFRHELGLSETDTVILLAGTVSMASGAEIMLAVAEKLFHDDRIRIVFVGEGVLLEQMIEAARNKALSNMLFCPLQPRERLADVQAISDISVVTVAPGAEQSSVPSKVLGYMAAARPVLASAAQESETARFIVESGAGVVVPPGDSDALAQAILSLQDRADARRAMGERGRRYLEERLSKQHIVDRYHEFLNRVASN